MPMLNAASVRVAVAWPSCRGLMNARRPVIVVFDDIVPLEIEGKRATQDRIQRRGRAIGEADGRPDRSR